MSRDIEFKYFEKYIELKPINDKFKYYDSGTGEDIETTAFSVLEYIHGFKEIQKGLRQEIKENYYNTYTEPIKFRNYAKDYIEDLNNLIKDIPLVEENQVKEWLGEFFKIDYDGFNSIYKLLTCKESLTFLADDWLSPGVSPSIYPEVQYGLYHFTKIETVKMIKHWINRYLQNTINGGQNIKNSVLKENPKFTDYFDETVFDESKMDLVKQLITSNKRQKDIAIITCVLIKKSIINIKIKERAKFFRAIYNYIDIEPPNKFSGINSFIDPNKNPIEIKNVDIDYKYINTLFEKII